LPLYFSGTKDEAMGTRQYEAVRVRLGITLYKPHLCHHCQEKAGTYESIVWFAKKGAVRSSTTF